MIGKLTPLSVNSAYRRLIGGTDIDKAELLNHLISVIGPTYDIKVAMEGCLSEGDNVVKDDILVNGKHIRLFIAPIFSENKNHESLGVVMLIEDISEQKALERTREEFFSIASHELRTPLTAIRGNTSMILQYYGDYLSDPTLHEMVDDIFESSTRLISIVNDFLDMSRLEQGKTVFKLQPFDIVELCNEVIKEFEAGDLNNGLYLRVESPGVSLPEVYADRDRLKQVIINLVGNGIKFTEVGGVSIRFKQFDEMVQVAVSDSGKGIPPEGRELLFRKFRQASNNIWTRDSTRSTGLGLYVSKLIIEGMAGKIYLASSVINEGSTFVIEIPVAT
ncbi:MAG TPA: HAMP domain-containing sensor histidine kinase [Candidatus Saccharimonadales bacterium]|nr:HAMP domain-containing sensor histidine kinase [Candidatus Saccharimonadales bacterium]